MLSYSVCCVWSVCSSDGKWLVILNVSNIVVLLHFLEHKADQLLIFSCLPGAFISGSCITCSSPVEYSIHNTERKPSSHSLILSWKSLFLLRAFFRARAISYRRPGAHTYHRETMLHLQGYTLTMPAKHTCIQS